MKLFLVVVLALLALVHADEEWKPKTTEEVTAIRVACLKERPLTEDAYAKLTSFEYPDDEAVRQFILCASVKTGLFSTTDGFYPERLAKQFKLDLDESEVLALAQGCSDKNEQGSPVDVWAFRGNKCFMATKAGDNIKKFVKKSLEEEAAKKA